MFSWFKLHSLSLALWKILITLKYIFELFWGMKQVVQQELVISIQKLSAHYPGQLTAGGPTWAGGSNHRSSTILWFCASVTPVLKSIHVKCTEMSPCKMQCCSSGNRLHVEKYMEQLSKCSLRCTDFMVLM